MIPLVFNEILSNLPKNTDKNYFEPLSYVLNGDGANPFYSKTKEFIVLEYYYGSPNALWTQFGKWNIFGSSSSSGTGVKDFNYRLHQDPNIKLELLCPGYQHKSGHSGPYYLVRQLGSIIDDYQVPLHCDEKIYNKKDLCGFIIPGTATTEDKKVFDEFYEKNLIPLLDKTNSSDENFHEKSMKEYDTYVNECFKRKLFKNRFFQKIYQQIDESNKLNCLIDINNCDKIISDVYEECKEFVSQNPKNTEYVEYADSYPDISKINRLLKMISCIESVYLN